MLRKAEVVTLRDWETRIDAERTAERMYAEHRLHEVCVIGGCIVCRTCDIDERQGVSGDDFWGNEELYDRIRENPEQ